MFSWQTMLLLIPAFKILQVRWEVELLSLLPLSESELFFPSLSDTAEFPLKILA